VEDFRRLLEDFRRIVGKLFPGAAPKDPTEVKVGNHGPDSRDRLGTDLGSDGPQRLAPPSFYSLDGLLIADRITRNHLGILGSDATNGAASLVASSIGRAQPWAHGRCRAWERLSGPRPYRPSPGCRRGPDPPAACAHSDRRGHQGMGDLERLSVRAGQRTLSPPAPCSRLRWSVSSRCARPWRIKNRCHCSSPPARMIRSTPHRRQSIYRR
jgi:hypothetical protein